MKKYLAVLLLLGLFALPSCGNTDKTAFAGEWGATDQAKFEAQYQSIDWLSPDIVYVGHLTTKLTKPLMPGDQIIYVESTDGFRESGVVKVRSESINYESKTRTTFEGCKRSKDTQAPVRTGTVVAMLERGHYQKGDLEKYTIRFHMGNGESEQTDMLTVETWVDETKAWMPITKKLSDLKSVVLISNLPENLRTTRYDAELNQIYVEGFRPDSNRILTIRYQGYPTDTWYDIVAMSPSAVFEDYSPPPAGFENWITFSQSSPVLIQPGETRGIEVSFNIPKDAIVPPQRFMFWIWVGASSGDLSYNTAAAVTWLINMGR